MLDLILILFIIWLPKEWSLLNLPCCTHPPQSCGFMKPLPFPPFIICISVGKAKAKVMSLSRGEGFTDGKER